jgi:hypothetical protein
MNPVRLLELNGKMAGTTVSRGRLSAALWNFYTFKNAAAMITTNYSIDVAYYV